MSNGELFTIIATPDRSVAWDDFLVNTGRVIYLGGRQEVVIPRGDGGAETPVTFFPVDSLLSFAKAEQAFADHRLKPADLYSIDAAIKTDPQRFDSLAVCSQWKDGGCWEMATFRRGERKRELYILRVECGCWCSFTYRTLWMAGIPIGAG